MLALVAVLAALNGRWAWPPHCTIKGNISPLSRERIYHLPGDAFYDDARIKFWGGERWFCSEAEARAAGWRRARW